MLGETYPHRVITDLKAERAKSVEAVLKMRRNNQQFNSDRGYDLVDLPDGKRTVVFTKKEFRIDQQGIVIKETAGNKSSKGLPKGAQKKALCRKAAAKK